MNGGVIRLKKKEKLTELIQEWSTVDLISDKEEQYINDLMKIYDGEYRHDYSIFFPILNQIYQEKDDSSIPTLTQNIGFLRQYVDEKYCDESTGAYDKSVRQIVKLLDHLNLEASRLEVSNGSKSEIDSLRRQLDDSRDELKKVKNDLDKAAKKAAGLQTEFISILSIFSAVVLLFVVDTQAITSAMISMQNSSIFRVVLVASMCGLVLFNGLFMLFQFVSYIITKNSSNETRMLRFGKPLFLIDVILIVIMVIDVTAWSLCVSNFEPFNQLYYPLAK